MGNSRLVEKPCKNCLESQQDFDRELARRVPLRLKLQDLLRPDREAAGWIGVGKVSAWIVFKRSLLAKSQTALERAECAPSG